MFQSFYYHIHLPTKKGNFIIWFCHNEISQNIGSPALPSSMLLVLLKSCQQIGVHQGGFAMFKPTLQKLFTFE
jgi:hypothetical protein